MKDIELITKDSKEYPQKLFCMAEPPKLLYAIGNLNLLNSFSIAIVGSRVHSQKGELLTKDLVAKLTLNNICIISGMAIGIDSIAHKTCIENSGNTIAILGGGFDLYKNKTIFKKILENNGLVLSEYLPNTPAFKHHFIRRNEIIAGLADGVIVTEGKLNSGTLITAKHALNLKKELYTFPGDISDKNLSGNNYLLTLGAKCILSFEDLLKYFPNFTSEISLPPQIPEEYAEIYNALSLEPIHINTLSKKLNLPVQNLKSVLTLMEMDGFVKKLPNENYIYNS